MRDTIRDRLSHAWNAFAGNDKNPFAGAYGEGTSYRPDRSFVSVVNSRSMITTIYTRIAVDVASIELIHARTGINNRYEETIDSFLNECLTVSANIDQTGRAFLQDCVASLFENGVIAIVPVETTLNPNLTGGYDIASLRVGKVVEWFPNQVRVELYNEKKGFRETILLDKKFVAIVENPLYAIMNQPNSTLQRLTKKLSLLDQSDEKANSGKLDIIIQLPYTIKTPLKRQQAEERRKDIEMQLTGSTHGIAYIDAAEKVTQLNRPAENQLIAQIENLTKQLYSQLGISEEVLLGTATEQVMINYHTRTIEPILGAIALEMRRKFLTKTARTQHQSITFYRDPFKLVTVEQLAKIADSFTRNEILTSNEIRQIMSFRPSDSPKADQLVNSNLNQKTNQQEVVNEGPTDVGEGE